MKQLGYIEGQNLTIERRFLGKRQDTPDETLRELVRLDVDVIVAVATPAAAPAKRATTTIPIVFLSVRAPVERGLVGSLARPGGNITGLSTYAVDVIDPKLLEIAKELLPRLERVAILSSSVDPPGATDVRERAARALGIKLAHIPFSNDADASRLPAAIEQSKPQALIAPDTPLHLARRKEIVEVAAKKRLPAVYAFRESVEDGGLMALSTDFYQLVRRGALYVDKILKGAKPGDLPVEQPTRLDFVINLKTARTLGLTIPPPLLLRADQVIQ